MFSAVLGMFSQDLAVDLGSARTRIYLRGSGLICNEPTVVAVHSTSDGRRQVVAVGEEARAMLGRTPDDIDAIQPVRGGRIVDFEVAEAFLLHLVRQIHGRNSWIRPKMAVALPHGCTDMELRALRDSCESAGAREVHLVPRSLMAGLGAGLPVHDPAGHLIVDVGAGGSEVSVLSLSGIVHSQTLPVGGQAMDLAIQSYIKRHHGLLIGLPTAERVKIELGAALLGPHSHQENVKGRCLRLGVPRAAQITTEDVHRALAEHVKQLATAVRQTLHQIPPELASDVVDHGVVMVGGGSLLRGLDEALRQATGLPVVRAEQPEHAVVEGVQRTLEELDLLEALAC